MDKGNQGFSRFYHCVNHHGHGAGPGKASLHDEGM